MIKVVNMCEFAAAPIIVNSVSTVSRLDRRYCPCGWLFWAINTTATAFPRSSASSHNNEKAISGNRNGLLKFERVYGFGSVKYVTANTPGRHAPIRLAEDCRFD
jgi:hypothetical protein